MIDELLQAYDDQLRAEGEIDGAESVSRLGPLWLAVYDDGQRGHVTYRDLGGAVGGAVDDLILSAIAYFRDETSVTEFEWKTRGHDAPTDLGARLLSHDFVPDEVETVMIGEADALAVDVPVPEGVVVRRAGDGHDLRDDVERSDALSFEVFGRGAGHSLDGFLRELTAADSRTTLWIAEAEGDVVCSGRLRLVPGTDFAGLWGGATHRQWRKQGIYRALTAARARYAIDRGVRYLHSDSTAMSRPILERAGLYAVTTTTPYLWTRP